MSGLCTKIGEFYISSILASHFKLVALTETWLNNSINDAELFDIANYNVFRKDRDFKMSNHVRGGGVLLAVDRTISASICDNSICDNICDILPLIDLVIVKINFNFRNIYILVVYIPPFCNNNDYVLFFDFLCSMSYLYEHQLIILGDFNCPEFVTSAMNKVAASVSFQCINNFMAFYNLDQYNKIVNVNNRLLDLVLTNSDQCVVSKSQNPFLKEHKPSSCPRN